MQVILLERVAKLGQMGEVVKVRDGYARNFLLPQGKALRANDANIARFEDQKAQLEVRNLETKKEAAALAEKLDGQTFIVIRSASDGGALYGSVTPRDAADAATEGGFSVDKRQVILNAPIKDLGIHDVTVRLHPEVDATIRINVARSVERDATYREIIEASRRANRQTVADAIVSAAREIAETTDIKAICCFTQSGTTASLVARERPHVPILALTPVTATLRRLCLTWGVHCVETGHVDRFKAAVVNAVRAARDHGFAQETDQIVVTAGVPFNVRGTTNILRVAPCNERLIYNTDPE